VTGDRPLVRVGGMVVDAVDHSDLLGRISGHRMEVREMTISAFSGSSMTVSCRCGTLPEGSSREDWESHLAAAVLASDWMDRHDKRTAVDATVGALEAISPEKLAGSADAVGDVIAGLWAKAPDGPIKDWLRVRAVSAVNAAAVLRS
jgi:hypothetical protein